MKALPCENDEKINQEEDPLTLLCESKYLMVCVSSLLFIYLFVFVCVYVYMYVCSVCGW